MTEVLDREALIAARRASLAAVYIETPDVTAALNAIHDLRLHPFRPPDNQAGCILITGPTNSGKSRLIQEYRRRTDALPVDGKVPIPRIKAPRPYHPATLFARILTACDGMPFPEGKRWESQAVRAQMYLKKRASELLFVEELNQIIDKTEQRAKTPYIAADHFKDYILDEAHVPIVFSGIDVAAEIFERNTQLKSRRRGVFRLNPYSLDNETERERFELAIEIFESAAGFPRKAGLSRPASLQRLHRATEGVTGGLFNLFDRSIILGTTRGATVIDLPLLAEAHAIMADAGPGWVNVLSVPVLPPVSTPDDSRVTPLHERKRGARK